MLSLGETSCHRLSQGNVSVTLASEFLVQLHKCACSLAVKMSRSMFFLQFCPKNKIFLLVLFSKQVNKQSVHLDVHVSNRFYMKELNGVF